MARTPRSTYLPQVKEIIERGGHITVRAVAKELGVPRSTAARLLDAAGKPRAEPGAWSGGSPDADVMPVLRSLVAAKGRSVTIGEALEAAEAAGLSVGFQRMRPLLNAAKRAAAEKVSADPLGVLEPTRWDGLVYAKQLVEAYGGADRRAVACAVRRGELTPVRREGRKMLFDPAKIRPRRDGYPVPVDAWHPLAAE